MHSAKLVDHGLGFRRQSFPDFLYIDHSVDEDIRLFEEFICHFFDVIVGIRRGVEVIGDCIQWDVLRVIAMVEEVWEICGQCSAREG